MGLVFVFSSDPGIEVLTANGPVINLILEFQRIFRFSRGLAVLGLVGNVVDDRGLPNVPTLLSSIADLQTLYGGFRQFLGEGVPAASVGAPSGYEGNLFAQTLGLDAGRIVLQVPNHAIQESSVDLLVSFTRGVATFGAFTLPAGFRISNGTTYVLATLETVSWTATETGDKTVRVRQVSDSTVTPVALNLVTTLVDTPADVNVTVNTTDTTVPDLIDATEVNARYATAFTRLLDNVPGRSIQILTCDRTGDVIQDALAAAAVTGSDQAYFRIAVGSPPIGTSAVDAEGSGTDGVGRATLDRSRYVYVHPFATRSFEEDAVNLVGPNFEATFPAGPLYAARIAQERPEANPSRPHRVLRQWGMFGIETLTPPADLTAHFQANIVQPTFDVDPDIGTVEPTFHAGILANGTEIASQRIADFIAANIFKRVRPYHKNVATQANQDAALEASSLFLELLLSQERIRAFTISGDFDPPTQMLTIDIDVQEIGNANIITVRLQVGVDDIKQEAA